MVILKNQDEINKIRYSCGIVAEILDLLTDQVQPGVSTLELSRFVESEMEKRQVKAAFKGYKGFPEAICTSINDAIVHGIPNNHKLAAGDIVSIDIGVLKDGFYGDSARTYAVGEIDEDAKKLMQVTRESLERAIEEVRVGKHVQDISCAVQTHAENHKFSIVRDFVGHGIGRQLHEDPPVPNFGRPGMGPKLENGMVLAIEPMINEGVPEVIIDEDGWTARTQDGKRSAHFEHVVAVTSNGPQVLTTTQR